MGADRNAGRAALQNFGPVKRINREPPRAGRLHNGSGYHRYAVCACRFIRREIHVLWKRGLERTAGNEYDIILLGYPNWWASIPMPIASFLEEYDFSGKTIVPFCSHGGGLFGQSLTAIAKLAPDSVIGEGLSVHYSGGASLSSDVTEWLKTNGISSEGVYKK